MLNESLPVNQNHRGVVTADGRSRARSRARRSNVMLIASVLLLIVLFDRGTEALFMGQAHEKCVDHFDSGYATWRWLPVPGVYCAYRVDGQGAVRHRRASSLD